MLDEIDKKPLMIAEGHLKWLIILIAVYLTVPLLGYILIPYLLYGNRSTKKRIVLYVLGDIGHSPRMCYHALSFSERGWQVELCGYVEDTLPEAIVKDSNITVHALPVYRTKGGVAGMVWKVVMQVFSIALQLWDLRGSDYLMMQNPPSIPILPLAVLYRLTGCKLIIDWHNLGYTILQMKFDGSFWHPFVVVHYLVEYVFAKFATYNVTVTKAMKGFLVNSFGLNAKSIAVLYDRPAAQFQPLPETCDRARMLKTEPFIRDYIPDGFDVEKGDKIIVTSTSFTADEDIGVLLGALKIYENSYEKFDRTLPRIMCFITGKGPLKEKYLKQVKSHEWNRCKIEFVWLTSEDYPKLLRLCDYGVSLHTSSSGLDLPMKILDMLGSGLPVIASNYPVLDELLQHNVNGLKFTDRRELHESLIFAMKDPEIYETLKKSALIDAQNRWDSSWELAMKELKIVQ